MRKLVVRFLMLIFVLGMSTTAWAAGMIDSQPIYSAQLTAHVSSTGGGKVYVSETDETPAEDVYDQTSSATKGLVLSMPGMARLQVAFWAWQKADDGYYFAGWSYADKGFDLGTDQPFSALYDVSSEMAEVERDESGNITNITQLKPLEYVLYATFEPVKMVDYTLDGSNTITEGNTCTQHVTVDLSGEEIDVDDFNAPTLKSSTGGTWTNSSGSAWTLSDLTVSDSTLEFDVLFTAPDEEVATSAELLLTTKADVSMTIQLNARRVATGEEAIRYNKAKTEEAQGTLADMLAGASDDDIIRLNGDYADPVTINKKVTFDLNGYVLSNTLTVSGSEVTLAYSPYGGSAIALNVTGGKVIVNGGTFGSLSIDASGTVEQNGATITGSATNAGTLTTTDGKFQGGLTSTGALTVNGGAFDGNIAIDVTKGTAQIKKGTITGITYGVQTSGGSATIEKLAVIYGKTKALNSEGGSLVVNSGKFLCPDSLANGTIVFQSAYFQKKKGAVDGEVHGKKLWRNTSGAEFREGYNYFAGDYEAARAAGVSVCHIAGTSYSSLEEALAFANNTDSKVIIIMDNNYTLPAGYYTLPENAILIVPHSNEQGNENKTVERVLVTEAPELVAPTEFRCLTLANGVNLEVFGTIEVTGKQYSTNEAYTSAVFGPYGRMQLNEGSKIVLQNGSELRAWGYITGDLEHKDSHYNVPAGEIDARRGAMIREPFQMGDWKGAYFSGMGLLNGNTVFPLMTYFIQNIEAPVVYHPGAKLSASAAVTAVASEFGGMANTINGLLGSSNISMSANDIQIIGVSSTDNAMFLMDEKADADNTWVRKWYDASKDQQVYEINSGAHIGSLVIPLVSSPYFAMVDERFPDKLTMNSGQYNLPITNNFKLHLLSGEMAFTQSTELLPGSEVEVDKGATVYVYPEGMNRDVVSGFLYVYDADEWGNYAGGVPARHVQYSPVFGGEPTTRGITLADMTDASINVHGTFDTRGGYVLTSESGANIYSSEEDAGTFIFSSEGAYDGSQMLGQVTTTTGGGQKDSKFTSAKLKNGAEYTAAAYESTEGAAEGAAFCYMNMGEGGKWTVLEQRGCFTVDVADPDNVIYYIKPQEYVAVVVNDVAFSDEEGWVIKGNKDYTFSDAAGAGRLFILLTDELGNSCQWWEVEQKDNYYHCIHPENDTYYWWNPNLWEEKDEDDAPTGKYIGGWDEVRFTITWKNWDGTELKSYIHDVETDQDVETPYQVTYGTMAQWLGSNPTRPATVDYTYDFTGWSPALDKVTSDVTYTATYEEKQIKYTIVFEQDGGMEIERHLLARNEFPVCENVPTRTGYILEWYPALAAVTGNQTYTATWLPEPPEKYEIKFLDYDGIVLDRDSVEVGTLPTPPADPSGKPASSSGEYTYEFDHWSPALEEVSTTSAKVYTAVYREEAVPYTVIFLDEDNSEIERHEYAYGETPVCSATPTKPATVAETYTFAWEPQIETVRGAATYKATFTPVTNRYTVTLKANPSGACTFTGAGTFDYGTEIAIARVDNEGYTFVNWTDGKTGAVVSELPTTLTGDVDLVANFNYTGDDKVTITWKNWNGGDLGTSEPKVNAATTFIGATPTREASKSTTYTFYGWYTKNNKGDTLNIYKNGMTPKATAPATYYAYFTEKTREYTIYWKKENGTDIEVDYNQPYGVELAYNSAIPTKNADAEYSYTFDGWSASQGGEVEALPAAVSGDAAFYAHFSKTPVLPTNLILGASGSADLASEDVKKNDLVITSNGINSSELKGANNLTLTGEAIFRLEKNFAAQTWYAVAVPWTVALSGIRDKSGNAFAANSVYVLEFDANAYATANRDEGRNDYWHFLDQNGHDMQPGKLYMIWFKYAQTAVQFYKKDGAEIWNTETSVSPAGGSIASQSNWNAIANPALYHADLAVTVADAEQDVLKYNGNDSYVLGSTSNMIVGEPMFVQVSSPATVVAVQIGGASPAPYHRAPETTTEADNRFVVELTQAGQLNDRMIVQTAEEKADTYVIGKDLAKMSLSAQNAQMWINRYDAKLCKNTLALQGESVEYPLNISAPQAGEYVLSASQERGNATLYLTRNGEAIWNLSESDYVMTLEQGTTAEYGLRVSAKAPQVATGMDEAVVDAQGETQKVLIDNKVFIIRGNNVYTVDGQMVK